MRIQSGANFFIDKWISNECTHEVSDKGFLSKSPTSADNVGTHWVVYGRERWCVKNYAMARDNELHEVRCCSDIEITGWRKSYRCGIWRRLKINNKFTLFIASFYNTTILLNNKMQELLIGLWFPSIYGIIFVLSWLSLLVYMLHSVSSDVELMNSLIDDKLVRMGIHGGGGK